MKMENFKSDYVRIEFTLLPENEKEKETLENIWEERHRLVVIATDKKFRDGVRFISEIPFGKLTPKDVFGGRRIF